MVIFVKYSTLCSQWGRKLRTFVVNKKEQTIFVFFSLECIWIGGNSYGYDCCMLKNPVHLLKREGVRPGVPGLIGSIVHNSTL